MAHHFTINTQTPAGKRMQVEMRKRMREGIQRDHFITSGYEYALQGMPQTSQSESAAKTAEKAPTTKEQD